MKAKINRSSGTAVATACLAALCVHQAQAQNNTDSKNQFTLGARFGFNIDTTFRNTAPFQNAGPAAGNYNRIYNDGHVGIDPSGNLGGRTGNWGFDNASQLQLGGRYLNMTAYQLPLDGYSQKVHDPSYGFELGYARELLKLHDTVSFGVEGAFSYSSYCVSSSQGGGGTVIHDLYNISGLGIAGPVSYDGTTAGPRIPAGPQSRSSTPDITSSWNDKFDSSFYGFKLGPYFDIPLMNNLKLTLSGGFAAVVVDGEFHHRQAANWVNPAAGAPALPAAYTYNATTSKSDALFGGYLAAKANYALNQNWGAWFGVEYQNVGDYTIKAGAVEAKTDLSAGIYLNAGVSYSF